MGYSVRIRILRLLNKIAPELFLDTETIIALRTAFLSGEVKDLRENYPNSYDALMGVRDYIKRVTGNS